MAKVARKGHGLPAFLSDWLVALTQEQADELWEYLDSKPQALANIMDAIPFDAEPMKDTEEWTK